MRGLAAALFALLCALAFTSCRAVGFGSPSFPRPGQACKLSDLQKNSMWEPLEVLPMVVYVDRRLKNYRGAIESAIDTWNSFAEASLHKKFFILADEQLPAVEASYLIVPKAYCSAYGKSGGLFIASDPDENHWKRLVSGYEGGLAVTGRCFHGDAGSGISATAAIVINTWASPSNMLETEILHELGHVIGLDHSCRLDSARYGHVKCAELPIDHLFRSAVMAPQVQTAEVHYGGRTIVSGTPHESLESNDVERAYCLYTNQR